MDWNTWYQDPTTTDTERLDAEAIDTTGHERLPALLPVAGKATADIGLQIWLRFNNGVFIPVTAKIADSCLRVERGSFKHRGQWVTDKLHAHFDPIPGSKELMKHHLPYQLRGWWGNLKTIIARWFD